MPRRSAGRFWFNLTFGLSSWSDLPLSDVSHALCQLLRASCLSSAFISAKLLSWPSWLPKTTCLAASLYHSYRHFFSLQFSMAGNPCDVACVVTFRYEWLHRKVDKWGCPHFYSVGVWGCLHIYSMSSLLIGLCTANGYHTLGYPMPLPIVRLVMELTLDLVFTKNQADLRCLAHQNKLDNGQRHRVYHPVL